MDLSNLVPALALGTLLAFTLFALFGKAAIEKRRTGEEPAPKSTLAADKASDGQPADV